MAEAIARYTKQTLMKNGYSTNGLTSSILTRAATEAAELIINMTGRSREDIFRGLEKVEDWIVQDPYGEDPETYQRVFEGIRRRVNQLVLSLRGKRMSQRAAR